MTNSNSGWLRDFRLSNDHLEVFAKRRNLEKVANDVLRQLCDVFGLTPVEVATINS